LALTGNVASFTETRGALAGSMIAAGAVARIIR
jgi:hypothetical protein